MRSRIGFCNSALGRDCSIPDVGLLAHVFPAAAAISPFAAPPALVRWRRQALIPRLAAGW